MRDELTLNTLESEYRLILLQQARDPNPWKLITDPTLLDYPIAPNKKNITLIFTFFGLFFDCCFINSKYERRYCLQQKSN